jgi:hypothetical protein
MNIANQVRVKIRFKWEAFGFYVIVYLNLSLFLCGDGADCYN